MSLHLSNLLVQFVNINMMKLNLILLHLFYPLYLMVQFVSIMMILLLLHFLNVDINMRTLILNMKVLMTTVSLYHLIFPQVMKK